MRGTLPGDIILVPVSGDHQGMIIEPCKFLEPLGRGTFGEVWRVEYCRPGPLMGKLLAAKISYLHADHEDITREMAESVPIITEEHPHILRLFCIEGFVGGRLLLLMELADGSLLDRWRQGQSSGAAFPLAELVRYMRQATEALDYIHGQSLAHGGINPADILLVNGQVKIADPGPPILSDQAFARIQTTNLSKAICMAPERKRGKGHFQSDQYALAATYAWLRVGRPVLGLDSPPPEAIFSVTGLPQAEQEVLVKALSTEPNGRFPTCIEFADALQRAITDT
jgi:eukaryotic-like serine/threonine-protein kinase